MSSRRRSRSRDRVRDRHYRNDVIDTSDRYSSRDHSDKYRDSSREYKSDTHHPSSSSRVPRSKRHRDSTFVSHWDELPDPNNPPVDPLSFLQAHPNAPKLKQNNNNSKPNTDGELQPHVSTFI